MAESGKSEKARLKAQTKEIDKLASQLPDRLRHQMEELFRARFTRIQTLDLDKLSSGNRDNH